MPIIWAFLYLMTYITKMKDWSWDLVQIYVTEQTNWFISDQNSDVKNSYLSICSNGASTVSEKFWHVIVANKLPQTGL